MTGHILRDEEVAQIRAWAAAIDGDRSCHIFFEWVSQFGVHSKTIHNILNDVSYRRPTCYPLGSRARADAEQRERDYHAGHKQKQRMRYVSATKHKAVLARDNYECVYCSADLHTEPLAIDHKVPVAAGGTNDIANLQATCKTCNARKKGFNAPETGIGEYLARRRQIDQVSAKVFDVLSPIVGNLAWADGKEAFCPWCKESASHIGEVDKFPVGGFVWRCKQCRHSFAVCNWEGLREFLAGINDVIWGKWYASEELTSVVSTIIEDAGIKTVTELVARWAGDVVEVKRRRHTHARDKCWCEFGLSDFRVVGKPRKQTEPTAAAL